MSLVTLTLAIIVFAGSTTTHLQQARTPPRAIIVAWDGAVPAFVNEMLAQGKLPNLAQLIGNGAYADDVITVFPSKTAPGFASLWSGAPPRVTGITGNRQPRAPAPQHSILESTSAFLSAPLRAEPLWAVALHAGRRVVLANAPLGREFSDGAVKLLGYDGYAGRDGVIDGRAANPQPATSWKNLPASAKPPLEIQFTIGASTFFGLFVDSKENPHMGYDSLLVTGTRDGTDVRITLSAHQPNPASGLWSRPLKVKTSSDEEATVYLRLFDVKPDGRDFALYHTRPARSMIFPSELAAGYAEAAGAFIGNGASIPYQEAALGPTLVGGGDGTAEDRYLETVRMAQGQLTQTALWAMRSVSWNLLFVYSPFPDEGEHVWRGYMDLTAHTDKRLAVASRRFLEEIYKIADDLLGAVMAQRPDNTLIALVSDHGAEGVHKLVAINRMLERHGLLVLNAKGQPDLSRTKAFYPPSNNGYLLINSTNRKHGVVTQRQRASVISQVRAALLGIRDGDRTVVTAIYDAQADGEAMGIGGESGGDLYIDLLPGYDFDPRSGSGDIITHREPHGAHGFNPARQSMRTIMILNGPGVAAGKRLKDVRIIDFAPTLAKLLGLPAPKNATGNVLPDALTDSR